MRALLLCLLLVSCGGGGGSSNSGQGAGPPSILPVAPKTLDRFVGPLLGNKTHGVLTNPANVFAGEFFAEPGAIRWGTSREHWEIRDCAGSRYAVVTGYENTVNGDFYAIETVRETVGAVDTVTCGAGTFTKVDFTPGVLVTESWFLIWSADHKVSRPGYWKGIFTFGGTQQNPCTGETLPVVRLTEVWWDETGWVRGHPTKPDAIPWQGGVPVNIEVNAIGETTFALDRGVWTVSDAPGSLICLHSLAPW